MVRINTETNFKISFVISYDFLWNYKSKIEKIWLENTMTYDWKLHNQLAFWDSFSEFQNVAISKMKKLNILVFNFYCFF